MARKQLTSIDMAQLEILNLRLQNLAAAPGSPVAGQAWYNTTTGRFEYRGASATIDPTDRTNHSGSQLASTISNLAATVQAYRLDQFAAPTAPLNLNNQKIGSLANGTVSGDAVNYGQLTTVQNSIPTYRLDQFAAPTAPVNMNSQKITSLANGTANGDAINYGQLIAAINGNDWKTSVRLLSTTNLSLTGAATIDGTAVVTGDRVAAVGQSTASQIGIYVANTAGAWTRAADADVGTLSAGASFFVEEGTTYKSTQWRLLTPNPITVGTTALSFGQIGATTNYTADETTIHLSGTQFSAITTAGVNGALVRKFAATIVGGSTSEAVTHNLGTNDVTVAVFQVSDGAEIVCDITRTSTNVVTLGFAAAPAAASLRCVVHG